MEVLFLVLGLVAGFGVGAVFALTMANRHGLL